MRCMAVSSWPTSSWRLVSILPSSLPADTSLATRTASPTALAMARAKNQASARPPTMPASSMTIVSVLEAV